MPIAINPKTGRPFETDPQPLSNPFVTMKNLNTIIGERITKCRTKSGITQEELATKLLLSRTSIVNIESGRQQLTMDNLYRITVQLDIELTDILPTQQELAIQLMGADVVELVGGDSERMQKMLVGFL